MNRSDLTHNMTKHLPDIPQRDVEQAIKLLFDQLSSTLVAGGRCEIRRFGTFSMHRRKARSGRNPKTGEVIAMPEKRAVYFKPSKLLKEKVNLGRTDNPTLG